MRPPAGRLQVGHTVAQTRLELLRAERNAARRNALDEALAPLLEVAAGLRTSAERDAVAVYILRRFSDHRTPYDASELVCHVVDMSVTLTGHSGGSGDERCGSGGSSALTAGWFRSRPHGRTCLAVQDMMRLIFVTQQVGRPLHGECPR
jgi:hypothetical protein